MAKTARKPRQPKEFNVYVGIAFLSVLAGIAFALMCTSILNN